MYYKTQFNHLFLTHSELFFTPVTPFTLDRVALGSIKQLGLISSLSYSSPYKAAFQLFAS